MAFCSYCGSILNTIENFCEHCGNEIKNPVKTPTMPLTTPINPPQSPPIQPLLNKTQGGGLPKKPHSKLLIPGIVMMSMGILCAFQGRGILSISGGGAGLFSPGLVIFIIALIFLAVGIPLFIVGTLRNKNYRKIYEKVWQTILSFSHHQHRGAVDLAVA